MKYDIFNRKAPAMPKPSRGTEFCKLLLSQASKDMQEPLVPMAIPALAAHLTNVKFLYSDNKYYELCGQMANLVAESGGNKGQLSHLTIGLIGQLDNLTILQFHDFTILQFHDFTISR
jgi:hypothetical protein